ncbi:hypothetical protein NDU88_003063 [Pleurodeles waltl]|uniref:Uncharacterized protein n=1 Tax=Pleurodeles waltl TaxID=8319 RepID=A0AAV7VF99_PLEWA|nr:hypothetical protein NDU88_003063 [Pleurodeles waltl]
MMDILIRDARAKRDKLIEDILALEKEIKDINLPEAKEKNYKILKEGAVNRPCSWLLPATLPFRALSRRPRASSCSILPGWGACRTASEGWDPVQKPLISRRRITHHPKMVPSCPPLASRPKPPM